ncbi:hypothetical protein CFAM422_007211 [Trichoderma lentiforme]|uniref:Uncharacterized protein n=1 Tax=Trichoderma lentiforme TaxID=1567552 RepID=A0A9P4XDJ7_9HYPO|nr:hypothetical protein CFAM422_007211 [Trichoderma lentiforme]
MTSYAIQLPSIDLTWDISSATCNPVQAPILPQLLHGQLRISMQHTFNLQSPQFPKAMEPGSLVLPSATKS